MMQQSFEETVYVYERLLDHHWYWVREWSERYA